MEIVMMRRKRSKAAWLFSATFMLLASLSALFNTTAQAQTILTSEPAIRVTPTSAPANVPRTIDISGTAISCGAPNITATLDSSLVSQTDNLLVRINGFTVRSPNLPPPLCDIIVPYRVTVSYTPTADGVIRIVPVLSGGFIVGGGRIVTTNAVSEPRSALDITGAWYDALTNGTGFTFVHSASRSDRLFGTYYTYDIDGVPRWFVINNLQWSSDGLTLRGTFASTEGLGQCATGLNACPMRGAIAASGNEIQIVFEAGPTTTQFPPPPPNWVGKVSISRPSGQVLYTGTLTRIGF
jgi:hypothetical protein